MEIGRLCIKVAGRDAKKKAVIVDVLESNYVLIDGEVRRRKCNISHLEPLDKKLNIQKNASHEDILKAFKDELNIELKERKSKEAKEKPVKQRKQKKAKDKKAKAKKDTKPQPKTEDTEKTDKEDQKSE